VFADLLTSIQKDIQPKIADCLGIIPILKWTLCKPLNMGGLWTVLKCVIISC